MKLIMAIINKEDAAEVSSALTKARYSVTKLATQGGFLMAGNVTILCGTDDDKVDAALEIIKEHSRQRKEIMPSTSTYGIGVTTSFPLEVTVGGATIFVLDIERFEKA
ncbi:MAG: cyclic-di-AMP receptor [Oscillospiraceae bacterium]|nr:cyclic-di-AMP receptor [Oscillospiraceae bacterium]